MRSVVIPLLFAVAGIFIAWILVGLQASPFNLNAFVAMVLTTVALLASPELAFYLLGASITFFDPRFSFGGINLWLHHWIILAGLILVLIKTVRSHQKIRLGLIDLCLGILLLTFAIPIINSPDRGLSLKWTLYFVMLITAYFLFRLEVSKPRLLRRVLVFLVLCGAANALIGVFLTGTGGRTAALVLNKPNALGNFLALLVPLLLSLLLSEGVGPRIKVCAGVSGIIIGIGLLSTFSRSAWLGAFTGCLALGFFRRRAGYFFGLILLAGILYLLPPVQERLVDDLSDSGVVFRRAKIEMAWDMFIKNPLFGEGPGSFQAHARQADYWGIKAHTGLENLYMRILAEGGILQAAAFLFLFIALTRQGIIAAGRLEPGFVKAGLIGSVAGCWVIIGSGIGEDPFIFPMINWLIGFFLAIIVISPRCSDADDEADRHPQPPPRGGGEERQRDAGIKPGCGGRNTSPGLTPPPARRKPPGRG